MSELFGEGNVKFMSGLTTVELEHVVREGNFFKPAIITHESIITGKRTYSRNEKYFEFTLMCNIWKYSDPNAKADELLTYENTVVTFFPWSDGTMIKECFLESVDFEPLFRPYDNDLAFLRFIGTQYSDVLTERIITKDGKWIKTKDGKYIKRKVT